MFTALCALGICVGSSASLAWPILSNYCFSAAFFAHVLIDTFIAIVVVAATCLHSCLHAATSSIEILHLHLQ